MAAGGHPFGDKEYGEYPESELEVADPEVDLGRTGLATTCFFKRKKK